MKDARITCRRCRRFLVLVRTIKAGQKESAELYLEIKCPKCNELNDLNIVVKSLEQAAKEFTVPPNQEKTVDKRK